MPLEMGDLGRDFPQDGELYKRWRQKEEKKLINIVVINLAT